jgi:hypothetical protein
MAFYVDHDKGSPEGQGRSTMQRYLISCKYRVFAKDLHGEDLPRVLLSDQHHFTKATTPNDLIRPSGSALERQGTGSEHRKQQSMQDLPSTSQTTLE